MEPPNKVWTVVATCRNCKHQAPPSAHVVEQVKFPVFVPHHCIAPPPLAKAFKQTAKLATTSRLQQTTPQLHAQLHAQPPPTNRVEHILTYKHTQKSLPPIATLQKHRGIPRYCCHFLAQRQHCQYPTNTTQLPMYADAMPFILSSTLHPGNFEQF